jgi:hypothetical protein
MSGAAKRNFGNTGAEAADSGLCWGTIAFDFIRRDLAVRRMAREDRVKLAPG